MEHEEDWVAPERRGVETVGARVRSLRLTAGLSQAGRHRWRRAQGGAAFLALHSRAPVYPALILGGPQTNQLLRAWLLPSRTPMRVIFGPQVDLARFYGRPIDRRLINAHRISKRELSWINDYHARVRREIAPLLEDEATRDWLMAATEPLVAPE